jgi:hypothetical protein
MKEGKGISEASPRIGIFWVVGGKLIGVAVPLTEGESYGDYIVFGPGHHKVWDDLQLRGQVPRDCEFEEFPRGRVRYDPRDGTFLLLADACILRNKSMVRQIMKEMHLQGGITEIDRDSHYRCSECLNRTNGENNGSDEE